MKYLLFLLTLLSTASCMAESPIVAIQHYGENFCSGFIATSDGNTSGIVTNQHCCMDNYESYAEGKELPKYSKIQVKTKEAAYKADIIAVDSKHDLCFLVTYVSLTPILPSKRSQLTHNELLLVISPDPWGTHVGWFIGQDTVQDKWRIFHEDSYIIRGNFIHGESGSGVLDNSKKLIGIFWGTSDDGKVGFIIGLKPLTRFIDRAQKLIYNNSKEIIKISE